jgi:hypothetical protein
LLRKFDGSLPQRTDLHRVLRFKPIFGHFPADFYRTGRADLANANRRYPAANKANTIFAA